MGEGFDYVFDFSRNDVAAYEVGIVENGAKSTTQFNSVIEALNVVR